MFQGFLCNDAAGNLHTLFLTQDQTETNESDPSEILFLAASQNEDELRAALQAVFNIAQQIQVSGGLLPSGINATPSGYSDAADQTIPPERDGQEVYVYAYTQTPEAALPRWKDCFYIGKGIGNRWLDHVSERLRAMTRGHPALTSKQVAIQSWIDQQNPGNPADLPKKAAGSLVRKVGTWTGSYAHQQAFAVEYFLITHCFGVHSISNETGGNMQAQTVNALARPAIFNTRNPIHVNCWKQAVQAFRENPRAKSIKNLWKPALLLLQGEDVILRLDAQLAAIGLMPHDMRAPGEGRLRPHNMLHDHFQVAGASDAIVTYSLPSPAPYRLELRFGAVANLTSLSLRPQDHSRASCEAFMAYFDNLVLQDRHIGEYRVLGGSFKSLYGDNDPIKNRKNWPFMKPFALDARGHYATWFDIGEPNLRTRGATNWIDGDYEMSLIEALSITKEVFCTPAS
jgi:hypothetical protein